MKKIEMYKKHSTAVSDMFPIIKNIVSVMNQKLENIL
jgi:hypothetical protein